MLDFHVVTARIPENANIILGQSHFIKTVEDVYEAMVNSAPQIRFGIAFNEASGPCLTRVDGNDEELKEAAREIATAVGAGHFLAVAMRDAMADRPAPRARRTANSLCRAVTRES